MDADSDICRQCVAAGILACETGVGKEEKRW